MDRRSNWLVKRLLNDWKEFCRETLTGISGFPSKENICLWHITIFSPSGNPIEATLRFGERYPLEPPVMKFSTLIYHPNIDSQGRVCILKDDWSPAHSVWSLLLSVRCILEDPNVNNPINLEAAHTLINDPITYQILASKSYEEAENHYKLKATKTWLYYPSELSERKEKQSFDNQQTISDDEIETYDNDDTDDDEDEMKIDEN